MLADKLGLLQRANVKGQNTGMRNFMMSADTNPCAKGNDVAKSAGKWPPEKSNLGPAGRPKPSDNRGGEMCSEPEGKYAQICANMRKYAQKYAQICALKFFSKREKKFA